MIWLSDVYADGQDLYISLNKLTGMRVVDVYGYVSGAFGEDTLVFKVSQIVFEGGRTEYVEGEHDIAYFPQDNDERMLPNLDEGTLRSLYEQAEG